LQQDPAVKAYGVTLQHDRYSTASIAHTKTRQIYNIKADDDNFCILCYSVTKYKYFGIKIRSFFGKK